MSAVGISENMINKEQLVWEKINTFGIKVILSIKKNNLFHDNKIKGDENIFVNHDGIICFYITFVV